MQRTDSAMSDIKQCLRKKVLAERRALSFDRISSMSLTLTENLLALPEVNDASCIMAFLAMPGESNLDEFIRIMLKRGTRICIPVCLPKRQMEAGRIMDMEHFEKGPLGLRNIPSGYDVIEPEQIDLVLVPAVACDRQGRRLGMGAGYYDRYLEQYPGALGFLGIRNEEYGSGAAHHNEKFDVDESVLPLGVCAELAFLFQ